MAHNLMDLQVGGNSRFRINNTGDTIITGSITVAPSSNVELQVTSTGVQLGNTIADRHNITGSFNITGSLSVAGITSLGRTTTTNAIIQRAQTPAGAYSTVLAAGTGLSDVYPFSIKDSNGSAIELRAGAPASDQYGGGILFIANGSTSALGEGNAIVFKNRTGTDTYTERMRIAYDGKVGIGSTSPTSKLEVVTSGGTNGLNISDGSTSDFIVSPAFTTSTVRIGPGTGGMALFTAGSEAIRINTSQNVGVGTTSPSERLHILAAGTTADVPFFVSGTDTKGGTGYLDFLKVENTAGGVTNPKKFFRINNSNGAWEVIDNAYSQVIMALEDNGNMTIAGTLTENSDRSLKTNIQTIPNALEKTLQLRGVEYDRISTNKHEIGLIAQEVEQIFPELVSEANGIKSVAYSKVVSILIESIKELKQEIDTLREQINKK
jgi:hypothetical protein